MRDLDLKVFDFCVPCSGVDTALFHLVVNVAIYQFGSAKINVTRQLIENKINTVNYYEIEEPVILATQFQHLLVFVPQIKHFLRIKSQKNTKL